jgi:hypothetical protein
MPYISGRREYIVYIFFSMAMRQQILEIDEVAIVVEGHIAYH